MTNIHRGDVGAMLAGTRVTLRPTFEALARMEGETGAGLLALARRFEAALVRREGDLRIGDVAAVLRHGIAAAEGKAPDDEALGALIAEAGLIAAAGAAFALIARALTGAGEPESA